MKRIVSRAHRKSISELKMYFKTGPVCHSLEEVGVGNCKNILKKVVWRNINEMANAKFGVPEDWPKPCKGYRTLDDVLKGVNDYVVNKWNTNKTSGWAEVKLTSNSYWITLSKGVLYVTSSTMNTFKVLMPQEKMVEMLFAYDAYIGRNDMDKLIEDTYCEYRAEERAVELLNMALKALAEDIWPEDMGISARQQKNGRLRCAISSTVGWTPEMIFRTDMMNFREDLIKAYERYMHKYGASLENY
jgi:hypothetical protein